MGVETLILIAIIAVIVLVVVGGLVVGGRARRGGPAETLEGGKEAATLEPPTKAPPAPEEEVDEEAGGTTATRPTEATTTPPAEAPPETPPAEVVEELTLAERFKRRLTRTRNVLGSGVAELFGRGISDEAWAGLEEALISADVGVAATMEIVEELKRRAREEGVTSGHEVVDLLKQELRKALGAPDRSLRRATDDEPTVWLMTGVNGTGKTTTIGKLAAIEKREGRKAVLAAADTFRAAAAEQLELWGERTDARVVRKDEGADPASVAYDGYMAARATDADLLIIDTAGRLHNKRELMDELSKVKRVVEKQSGPMEETLLVLDATTGQNGIAQAKAFTEAVEVTGLVLTKLDGSSKGGIVIAVQRELDIPVKLVGLGEQVDDLAPFDADAFVDGLFDDVGVA